MIIGILALCLVVGVHVILTLRSTRKVDRVIGEIAGIRQHVTTQVVLAKGISRLGLMEVLPDSSLLDFGPAFQNTVRLIIVLNDGRTWLSVNRDRLRKRFLDPEKETTVFLIHPQSAMMAVLARKGSTDVGAMQAKVAESVQLLREIKCPCTRLEVLGHDLFNPHSVILTDASATVIPYFTSRGGRTVPAFVYGDEGDGCYFRMLETDLEALRKDSRDILTQGQTKKQAELKIV